MAKLIVVTINHPPSGSGHFVEGLRTVMGLLAGTEDWRIVPVLLGDGVLGARRGVDRSLTGRSIATLAEWECGPKAERESLAERGLTREELAPDIGLLSRADVLDLLRSAAFTLDF